MENQVLLWMQDYNEVHDVFAYQLAMIEIICPIWNEDAILVCTYCACLRERQGERETLAFSVSAHLYFFNKGAYCNFLRNTGWSQPSKWPIDNLGQNWKDVLSFSHKRILSVHGMCRVCAKAIWRNPGA